MRAREICLTFDPLGMLKRPGSNPDCLKHSSYVHAPIDELLDERLAHLAAGPRYLSASYRGNSGKSQPSICGGLLAELSADKDTLRDPACVLCRHLAVVAGHQVAYLDRLNLPAMFSQQVTDVGALLVEP